MLPALCGVAAAFVPAMVHAHSGHGPGEGLLAGLVHPFAGLDHLATMVAVGLWAAKGGGRGVFLLPGAFLGTMALGAVLARHGVQLPTVDAVLTVSVIALGLLIASGVRAPASAAAAVVAAFALFHGHAHASGLANGAPALAYGAGFLAATALLHGAGILAGFAATPRVARIGGGAVAALGLALAAA
jgi:urease accessory protein